MKIKILTMFLFIYLFFVIFSKSAFIHFLYSDTVEHFKGYITYNLIKYNISAFSDSTEMTG